MSVGGKVIEVLMNTRAVYVRLVDLVNGDRYWRRLDSNEKTRCIGVGDSLWWQNHQGYWTPCESSRQYGKDADVSIGSCWDCKPPYTEIEK